MKADSVFTSRAIFVDSAQFDNAVMKLVPVRLSRLYRVVPIRPECVRSYVEEHGIEWYASWYIGGAPDLGFRGTLPGGSLAEVRRALSRIAREESRSRIVIDAESLKHMADRLRERGRKIVFTNGVFDLLHAGHLRLLQGARALGDALIVGINSDDSTRAIKGRGRPVIPQFARADILASLRCVDACFIFTETDPMAVLRTLRPDVLAKGSDYAANRIVGGRFVAGYGGKVARIPVVPGWSTTSTIRGLREK
ncbi:MAG TPA: adenylyltransferase/cytidyltransferase family protein [Spirochaetia bacterium]|nr:adenylyltransferase/cytidyltransferase family protein [Spirochaetia bacterium]